MMLSRVVVLLVAALAAAPVGRVAAQNRVVDAGMFVIKRAGERVGTETFTITQVDMAGGVQLRATATHREGDTETVDTLITDAHGSPTYYSYVRKERGAAVTTAAGSRSGNRFTLTSRTHSGDASTREMLVSDGMIFLDQELYSHFYFLFLAEASAQPATVVAPLTSARGSGAVRKGETESTQIGDKAVPGIHYTFGNTDIWTTIDHHLLLKLEIPAQRIVVTRDQPPR